MRIFIGMALMAAVMAPSATARAQQSDAQRLCAASTGVPAEQRLENCTAVIEAGQESPQNLAIAFYNRCTVYPNKPVYERTAADYFPANVLRPDYTVAPVNIRLAQLDKPQESQAVQDKGQPAGPDPKDAAALRTRAFSNLVGRNYERAIADFDDCLLYTSDAADE